MKKTKPLTQVFTQIGSVCKKRKLKTTTKQENLQEAHSKRSFITRNLPDGGLFLITQLSQTV